MNTKHAEIKKRLEEIANRKVKAKINPEVEHNLRMNENKRMIHKFQVNSNLVN